jgi:hypothetical protein
MRETRSVTAITGVHKNFQSKGSATIFDLSWPLPLVSFEQVDQIVRTFQAKCAFPRKTQKGD